jgi:hypothetical protein
MNNLVRVYQLIIHKWGLLRMVRQTDPVPFLERVADGKGSSLPFANLNWIPARNMMGI